MAKWSYTSTYLYLVAIFMLNVAAKLFATFATVSTAKGFFALDMDMSHSDPRVVCTDNLFDESSGDLLYSGLIVFFFLLYLCGRSL